MLYVYLGILILLIIGTFFLIPNFKKHILVKPVPLELAVKEKEIIAQLSFQANTDSLTGLYNHRYFSCQFDEMLDNAKKTNRPLSLILVDINDFKYCNLVLGRFEGDIILQQVAGRIKQITPQSGIAARCGGDEFFLLLPDYDRKKATDFVQNLNLEIKATFSTKELIDLTAGIACYPDIAPNKQILIDYAYQELSRQKELTINKLSTYQSVLLAIKEHNTCSFEPAFFAQFFLLTINLKDHYTLSHTNSVIKYAETLGSALLLSPEEIYQIKIGAMFHDVGKIQIPEQVLMKAGPLTEKEWHYIHRHPQWSGEILSALIEDETAISLVIHHHERYDGNGYPDGLTGDQIPLGARIITIADSFSAMITPRPYREAMAISQALIEVRKNAGTQFDPIVADTLIKIIDKLL
ncbi:MAG: diguanylate cyclase [Dehalobacterium sp.]